MTVTKNKQTSAQGAAPAAKGKASKGTAKKTTAKKQQPKAAQRSGGDPVPVGTIEERLAFYERLQKAKNHTVIVVLDGKSWPIQEVPQDDQTHTMRLLSSHLDRIRKRKA